MITGDLGHGTTAADQHRLTPDEALLLAYQEHQAGRLPEARRLYERVLRSRPDLPTALTMLGAIAYRQGDEPLGETYLDRAIEIYQEALRPGSSDVGVAAGLANLLLARGRTDDAERIVSDARLPLNPVRSARETFARRCLLARSRGLPPVLLVTVPKSASESIWNHIAHALGFAQSHVSIGLFPACCLLPHRTALLAAGGVIAKEHIGPSAHNLAVLERAGIRRLTVHLRDPRQAALSWAHFVRNDVGNRPLAPIWRQVVPPRRVLDGPDDQLLDWCIDHYLPLLVDFSARWLEQARQRPERLAIRFLTFESFRRDPDGYLAALLEHHRIAHTLATAAEAGEAVHFRRGLEAEWRTVFTRAQRRRATRAIPPDLAEAFAWPP